MDDAAAPSDPSAAWTCPDCGLANPQERLTCDRCGVARRWLRDPSLDLPPQPRLSDLPAFWVGLLHAGLTLGGAWLLLRPESAPFLALHPYLQGTQVLLTGAAAWTSLQRAVTERLLHTVHLHLPNRVQADAPLVAELEVAAYEPVAGVSVTLELLENTYRRSERRDPRLAGFASNRHRAPVQTVTKRLARHRMLSGSRLRGRRQERFEATFTAPFPNPATRDVQADLLASVYEAAGWLVPGLQAAARNLREHGGVFVRATVRIGPFRRVVEKRVVTYAGSGQGFVIG